MANTLNRILLVDDDTVTNLMHKRQIARFELAKDVDVATDGLAALDYLTAREETGASQPELVLLDINMPRMNGFEFLAAYAALPENLHESQSIVMVSTSTLRQDRQRAESEAFVKSYEIKPLSNEDFCRIVQAHQPTSGADS